MKIESYPDKDVLFIRILWVLFFLLLVLIFSHSIFRVFDHDEFESIHAAWKISSGQRIYIDFAELHHPFFYYTLIPLIVIFKETVCMVMVSRCLIFLTLLLIFFYTYKFAKNLFGKEAALFSLIFLSTTQIFVQKAIEVRPDVPQTLFGVLSVSALFTYFQKNSLKHLVISSVCLGMSFLFLQKAIFLFLITGGICLRGAFLQQIKFKDVFLYLIVFASVVLPYYCYLIINGQLHAYLICAWGVKMVSMKLGAAASKGFVATMFRFYQNLPLWILWLISLLFLDTPNKLRIGGLTLIFLIFLISTQFIFLQNFMQLIPFIAMMAGFALVKVKELLFSNKLFPVLFAIIIYSFYPINSYVMSVLNLQNKNQLKKVEYVESVTSLNDYVYDENVRFNLFRKDLDFIWYWNGTSSNPQRFSGRNNIYQLIDKLKPKVIQKCDFFNIMDDRIVRR